MHFSKLSNKLDMSYYLKKEKNEQKECINLSSCLSDLDIPEKFIEAFERNIHNKELHRSINFCGILELRELLASCAQKEFKINSLSYQNIIINASAQTALTSIMQALLNPGDEVIIFAPYDVAYPNIITFLGGIPKIVQLDEEEAFYPCVDDLDKIYNTHIKIIILSNPHYPTGMIWNDSILKEIATWAKKKNIFIIADERYSNEIFDNNHFISMGNLSTSFDNLAIVKSFSNDLGVLGWDLGWIISSGELIDNIKNIQCITSNSINLWCQYALLNSWTDIESWIKDNILIHQESRDMLYQALEKQHGFRTMKPQGGLSLLTNIAYYLGNEVGGKVPKTSLDFANIIFEKTGILITPGEMLGKDGFVQFFFSQEFSTLKNAVSKISAILEK